MANTELRSMTPHQCRAARGLLKWTQPYLAEVSGVGLSTINRYENGTRPPKEVIVSRLQTTLVQAGVRFLFESRAGGQGVRMRDPQE